MSLLLFAFGHYLIVFVFLHHYYGEYSCLLMLKI